MTEYRALVKHKNYRDSKWVLAVPGERTYKTENEAYEAINKAVQNGKPHLIKAIRNGEYITELFDDLEVVDYKVEHREVTPWEE